MDWKACIVQTLRASTFTSNIFFNSSVDPPRKRRNNLWDVRVSDVPILLLVGWIAYSVLWLDRAVGFDCLEGQDVSLFFQVWVQFWGPKNFLFSGTGFVYIGCIGGTWRWSAEVYGWSPTSISMSRIIRFHNASCLLDTVAELHKPIISFITHVLSPVYSFAWKNLAVIGRIFIKFSFYDFLKLYL